MPKNPREIVQGKAWGLWVRDAARALISATTPPRRYALVKAGYLAFQAIAGTALNNGTPFRFGAEELRWIFAMLERQAKRDLRQYPNLEKDFEARRSKVARKKHDGEVEQLAEADLDVDDYRGLSIVTENRFGRVH